MMHRNGFGVAALVLALVGAAGCTGSDEPEPVDVTQDAPRPTPPPDGDVAQTDVCAVADDAALERLLPGADDGVPGGTSGESYASATCSWGNSGEPSGSLALTVEVASTPDENSQRDVLDGVCEDAEVGEGGPGELSCTSVSADDAGAEARLRAVQGAALVEVVYARAGGGEVTDADRADLEELATALLGITPQP